MTTDNLRSYHLKEANVNVLAKANSCLFCDHCTDIFYDWHGIYALVCDIEKDVNVGSAGECEDFVEEEDDDS